MIEIESSAIFADVKCRVGRDMPTSVVNGRNGRIVKLFPWSDMPKPWSNLHVEATPDKRPQNGFSVHLDFYVDVIKPEHQANYNLLLIEIERIRPSSLLVVGAPFTIHPRPRKANVLVEQDNYIAQGDIYRDAKIAELLAHYAVAFDEAIRSAAARVCG